MAAMRVRAQPAIGTAQWIQDENAQVSGFCDQEAEDFTFAARNEVEWLNEHMAEILSNTEMNVADAFKTPGKLRGKTPRTIRKRNALETREPLSDIFSTNSRSTPLKALKSNPTKQYSPEKRAFKVAEDSSADKQAPVETVPSKTDSGYHGLTEDEMEIDQERPQSSAETHDPLDDFPHSPISGNAVEVFSTDNSTTERSFHSAREDIVKKGLTTGVSGEEEDKMKDDENAPHKPIEMSRHESPAKESSAKESTAAEAIDHDDSGPSSEETSPVHGLVRKSSLTFASLPAREPITTKKSIGNRISRTSQLDQYKNSNFQNGIMGRLTGGKSLGGMKQPEVDPTIEDEETLPRPQISREESDSDSRMTKLHNKSSTQRLHERINLLGKSQPPRPTKSIPSVAATVQPAYPDISRQILQKTIVEHTQAGDTSKDDDDDDWIQPPQRSVPASSRPQLTKSMSADVVDRLQGKEASNEKRPGGQSNGSQNMGSLEPSTGTSTAYERAIPASELENNQGRVGAHQSTHSTTPLGSPRGREAADGPLSASKFRLQSIMKTAKGLFSSSASASAQAKLDLISPSESAPDQDYFSKSEIRQDGTKKMNDRSQGNQISASTVVPPNEPRKTRSSTEKESREKEREALAIEQAEREKDKVQRQESAIQANAQAKEKPKDPASQPAKPTRQSPRKTQQREHLDDQFSRSVGPNNQEDQSRQSQAHRMKDVRRPAKPTKEAPAQQKAPPVNIRIGMPSRRVPLNNAAISSTLQDSLPPPNKAPGLAKKASNASIQNSGAGNHSNSSKSSAPAPKPKALIAAERKKEQDEREAQRKMEQKREIERRRAAQQEEARRQEQHQRQEAEKQKEKDRLAAAEDSRKQAQRQAIEKRRLEMQKKDQRPAQRAGREHNMNNDGGTNRAEVGGSRPPSRQANTQDSHRALANHQPANQSKAPIKRVFDPESDAAPARPAKPHTGQNYQQQDSKRRRTNEDEPEEFPMRPTKAPPIRQSGMRNGPKTSTFGQSYSTAPPPAAHHASSLIRSATTNQAYQQHMYQNQQARPGHTADTSKYQDGNKIPFAENPNPPHYRAAGQPQPFKTPLPTKLAQPTRQSPHYPNGENIQLQEIPTDSEDSDSSPDTAQKRQRTASLPEWVQSPYLNNLLRNQEEYMDPDAVFGPVGSPHLEEMFRERAHKFRSRTSSANWAGQDRLTQDEIRRDADARARIRREGGWTYGGTAS